MPKKKLQAKDDSCRYSLSDIQLMSYLLDVPDVVMIQYQEGEKPGSGAQNVSLQVSLPMYQNITAETVIEAQSLGSKEGSKGQGAEEQVPERSYVGYYEGTIGLFEKPAGVVLSKENSVEGLEVPTMWPPSLVYGITPSVSSDDNKHQQVELGSQPKGEEKIDDVFLAEFTETTLSDSVVQVTPIAGSDKTKIRVQTPLEKHGSTTPTAESTWEGKLKLLHMRKEKRGKQISIKLVKIF